MPRLLAVEHPFDLDATLDGTQDFRWREWRGDWRSGVLAGNLVHLRQVKGGLEYRAGADLDRLLRRYFRLDEDLLAVRAEISARDGRIREMAGRYPHLRLLRQPDPWECMVSYICSAQARIENISRMVEKIAGRLGERIELDGDTRHAFPPPEAVAEAGLAPLRELGLGLGRDRKIICAAERICAGRLDLRYLARPQVSYAEAKRRLMACHGVGDKIADCILLFALEKTEAFPVDTWVSRAMEGYFPSGGAPTGDGLVIWAQDYFGRHAGLANQLLFQEQYDLGNRPRAES